MPLAGSQSQTRRVTAPPACARHAGTAAPSDAVTHRTMKVRSRPPRTPKRRDDREDQKRRHREQQRDERRASAGRIIPLRRSR